ncbi:MAG TPA: hypothetical protein ENN80_06630, partial [Candidatus Hydrogenedentes bacterium]|nr:hypothetical protein [Candidatus Hydrogenedentota bacterium]
MKSNTEDKGEQSGGRSLSAALFHPVEEIVLSLTGWKSLSLDKTTELFFGFSEELVQLPSGKEILYVQACVKKMAKRRKGAYYGEALSVCVGYPREFMESIAVWHYLRNQDLDEKYFPNPDLSAAEREILLRVAGGRQTVKATVGIAKHWGLWSGFDINTQ